MMITDKKSGSLKRVNNNVQTPLRHRYSSESDDRVSVEELAEYLDVQLHIPRKINSFPHEIASVSPSTPSSSSSSSPSSASASFSTCNNSPVTRSQPRFSRHPKLLNKSDTLELEARLVNETPKCSMRKRTDPEITVEELAGYFDLQLHIPRKMSPMAELMYT